MTSRLAGGSASTAWRTAQMSEAAPIDGASTDGRAPGGTSSKLRAWWRRSRGQTSTAARRTIDRNQGPSGRSGSNVAAARQAWTNACCTASSANRRSESMCDATAIIGPEYSANTSARAASSPDLNRSPTEPVRRLRAMTPPASVASRLQRRAYVRTEGLPRFTTRRRGPPGGGPHPREWSDVDVGQHRDQGVDGRVDVDGVARAFGRELELVGDGAPADARRHRHARDLDAALSDVGGDVVLALGADEVHAVGLGVGAATGGRHVDIGPVHGRVEQEVADGEVVEPAEHVEVQTLHAAGVHADVADVAGEHGPRAVGVQGEVLVECGPVAHERFAPPQAC